MTKAAENKLFQLQEQWDTATKGNKNVSVSRINAIYRHKILNLLNTKASNKDLKNIMSLILEN